MTGLVGFLRNMTRNRTGRVALALIILNELRGVAVVAAIVSTWLKARGH